MNVRPHWVPAYIGIGSNLQNPAAQVRQAITALNELADVRLVSVSAFYSNPPMGPQDQPDYVNAVAGLLTLITPQKLLKLLQDLENKLGRIRSEGDRWGPRVIDLDLLIYGAEQVAEPGLDLPHPGIPERNFVLLPLCDIAPRLTVPGIGTVEVLARQISSDGLVKLTA